MRKIKKTDLMDCLRYSDIPTLLFIGNSFGFLFVGVMSIVLGTFGNSMETDPWLWSVKIPFLGLKLELFSWSLKAFLLGIFVIVISIAIGLIAALYWKLVPRKSGIIAPETNVFGLFGLIIAMLSGAMAGYEIIDFFLYRY